MKRFFLMLIGTLLCCTPAFGEGDFDFRGARWGDSMLQVKQAEKENFLNITMQKDDELIYKLTFFDKDSTVDFKFENDKLVSGLVAIPIEDGKDANDIFHILKEHLAKKYGKDESTDSSKALFFTKRSTICLYKEGPFSPPCVSVEYEEKTYSFAKSAQILQNRFKEQEKMKSDLEKV